MTNPITMNVGDVVKNASLGYRSRLMAAEYMLFWLCDSIPRDNLLSRHLPPSLYAWRHGRHVPDADPRRELVFVLEAIEMFAQWTPRIMASDLAPEIGDLLMQVDRIRLSVQAELDAGKPLREWQK